MGDDLEDFSQLLEAIHPEALSGIASRLRNGQTCIVDKEPRSGSFNLVYLITFVDGAKWAARIPQHGTRDYFGDGQAETMHNENVLLQAIHKETTIPVSEIVHFDTTFDNELGAPFSLATWLEGMPLYRAWFDPNGGTPLEQRRFQILESLADAAVQLGRWSAPSIGSLKLHQDSGNTAVAHVEQIRVRDAAKELDLAMDGVEEDPVCFYEDGPFRSTAEYLRSVLDSHEFTVPIPHVQGQHKLLEIIADSFELYESRFQNKSFVLAHPDFASQNVLVKEDGTVTRLLDWDGIHTVPTQIGYAKYPLWIMRGWLPNNYAYWAHNSPRSAYEDSPPELARYRKRYHNLIQQRMQGTESAGIDAINSHIFQALVVGCKDKHVFHSIVTKISRTCLAGSEFHLDYDILYACEGAANFHKHTDDTTFVTNESVEGDKDSGDGNAMWNTDETIFASLSGEAKDKEPDQDKDDRISSYKNGSNVPHDTILEHGLRQWAIVSSDAYCTILHEDFALLNEGYEEVSGTNTWNGLIQWALLNSSAFRETFRDDSRLLSDGYRDELGKDTPTGGYHEPGRDDDGLVEDKGTYQGHWQETEIDKNRSSGGGGYQAVDEDVCEVVETMDEDEFKDNGEAQDATRDDFNDEAKPEERGDQGEDHTEHANPNTAKTIGSDSSSNKTISLEASEHSTSNAFDRTLEE